MSELTKYIETKQTIEREKGGPLPFEDGKWDDFVTISENGKKVTFELQKGTFYEEGYNGCYPIMLVYFAAEHYKHLNQLYPSRENSLILTKLQEALLWDVHRSTDRKVKGSWGHGPNKKQKSIDGNENSK